MMNGRMSRREFIALAGVGAAVMSVPGLFAADRRKPNVIVILSDDHGYGAIGCQGCRDIPTPNIDSIARNGVRCTNGYVTCPVCSPTRAGLLTGRYQQRFGHEDNPGPPGVSAKDFGLPSDEKTVADYMKAQGYATGMVGKWHLGHKPECNPTKRGFDEFFGFLTGAHSYTNPGVGTAEPILRGTEEVDEKEYLTDAFGREAISFIDRHKEKPFFLYLAFNAVHAPLQAAKRYEDEFTQFKNPDKRKYAAMLTAMDEQIGRVLAKVREAGLEEDTLIFFLGDNGGYRLAGFAPNAPLSGFKGDTFEGGVRIPFIVQWKGKLPAGKTYDKPVISLDILPTAVTVAGGKPGANVEGVNLLPFLKGEKTDLPHDALYWQYDKQSAIRSGDWKLVMHDERGIRLYNLADDPGEAKNLADEDLEKVAELTAAWDKWNAKNKKPMWGCGTHPEWEKNYW